MHNKSERKIQFQKWGVHHFVENQCQQSWALNALGYSDLLAYLTIFSGFHILISFSRKLDYSCITAMRIALLEIGRRHAAQILPEEERSQTLSFSMPAR